MNKNAYLKVSGRAFVLLAALVLMLPLQWVAAVLFSGAVHELFHLLAIYLLGGHLVSISIGSRGAVIEACPMTAPRELFCAIAGPAGSLSLLLLSRWMPRVAICGLVQGIYNLIPLHPMDGGRILSGILFSFFSPPAAEKISNGLQVVVGYLLAIGCLILTFKVGFCVMPFCLLLLWDKRRENSLAKKRFWRYNKGTM